MVNASLQCLKKQAGSRNIHKTWVHPRVYPELQQESKTRAGRRRIRAAEHQAKLRHKKRILVFNAEMDADKLARNLRKELKVVKRLLNQN